MIHHYPDGEKGVSTGQAFNSLFFAEQRLPQLFSQIQLLNHVEFTISSELAENFLSGMAKLLDYLPPRTRELERLFGWEREHLIARGHEHKHLVVEFIDGTSIYIREKFRDNQSSVLVASLFGAEGSEIADQRLKSIANQLMHWNMTKADTPYVFLGEGAVARDRTVGSQFQQDLWVIELFDGHKEGWVLEIGAYHPVKLSNSYRLEKLGWNAICIEPLPRASFEQRSAILVQYAIGEDNGRIEFADAGEYSGHITSLGDKTKEHTSSATVIQVPTRSLKTILLDVGAPGSIDYVSLDIEGGEYGILEELLGTLEIGALSVEHNYGPDRERIAQKLGDHGYVRVERWHVDDLFVNPEYLPLKRIDSPLFRSYFP